MDINFKNKDFLDYFSGISYETRRQVYENIKSRARQFRHAVVQIGAETNVSLSRLTPEQIKKYTSYNSQGIKSKPRPKKFKTAAATQELSKSPSEIHSTSKVDTQLSSEHNAPLNKSLEGSVASALSIESKSSNKDTIEANNLSSTQNKPVLILDEKKNDRNERTNKNMSPVHVNKEENISSSLVEQKRISPRHTSSSNNKVKTSQSCPALNKINKPNDTKTCSSTKECNSTNKTHQHKAENNKKGEKKMNQKIENEKYKLTIIDLFGEDDSSREINIPAHKKIDNCSPNDKPKSPKKIFGDKSSAGDISNMRRKSICEDNEERTLRRSQSSDKISDRRKTICQENVSNEDDTTRNRNRSKSKDKEVITSKVSRRKSLFTENETSENDTSKRRNRSKSRDKEVVSTNKETKIDRRKSIYQEKETNKDNTTKGRASSKTLDKDTVKTTTKIVARRKTVCQENISSDSSMRRTSRSQSQDKKCDASKNNEIKFVRRKCRVLDSDSDEDHTSKRSSRSKSPNKKVVASKIHRSKSVSQEKESCEHDVVKKTNKSCDKESNIIRRKSIYQDNESTKRKTSPKSREDKNNSNSKTTDKSTVNKEVKSFKRSHSRDEEQISKKTVENTDNVTNKIRRKSVFEDKSNTTRENNHDKQSCSPNKEESFKKDNKLSIIKRRQSTNSKDVSSTSSKRSTSQEKTNFFTALKLNNSPANLNENSSSSKMSTALTQDESLTTSLDKTPKRKRSSNNTEKTPSSGESSRSSSKGSVGRESSKDKNSSSTPRKPSKEESNIVSTPKSRNQSRDNSTDSSNKKTPNKDKKIDTPNTPNLNTIEKQQKTPEDQIKQASCTPKRSKSVCERRETLESDSSLDDVNLDSRKKLANKPENCLRTPTKRSLSLDESSDTSSDMNLLTIKQRLVPKEELSPTKTPSIKIEKESPPTPKRIKPVEDSIEGELELIFNASTSKRQKTEAEEAVLPTRARSLSRCSFESKEVKEAAGKRKRSLSTCEICKEDDSSKRRKSQGEEEDTINISYINYADLVQQMLTTSPAKKPVDFVAPLASTKKGFSKPHYDEDNNVTYDSVIVIQETDNSPHKLLLRKKSKQEVEEFKKRIIARRHSFHFEDIEPKEEPVESSDEVVTIEKLKESRKPKESKILMRRKSIHEVTESPKRTMKPIKSILKRRSSDFNESSVINKETEVDLNDNKISEYLPAAIPVTIDLRTIDIDKMFPSSSNDDVITLEISSDDSATEEIPPKTDLKKSRLSTDSSISVDNTNKSEMSIDTSTASTSKVTMDTNVNNKELQSLSTEQAVDTSKDLFVSLLYIYEQYYKMTELVESQKLCGLTPDMTVKKNYFIKRRDSDLTKMYKKLVTVKVNHFSLIVFFDRLMKLLNDEFKNYKEISLVVIVFFMQRIIWILLDYFTSPSDEKYLFNHVTACESVEYLMAKYEEINKYATELDKKMNDCFNNFSKKINSETISVCTDILKTTEEPKSMKIVTLKKKPSIKPAESTPSKHNLSLPVIDSSEPSTSKPNPPSSKRRGRPPRKIIHPESVAVVPKPKLPPPKIPKANNSEMAGILANIDKTKSYLSSRTSSGPSKETLEECVGTPQIRRKSLTSYEVTFNNNSSIPTVTETQNNSEDTQPVPAPRTQQQQQQQQQQTVEPNKAIKILDVVVSHTNRPLVNQQYIKVVDGNKLINNQNQENTHVSDPPTNSQITSEILHMLNRKTQENNRLQHRMITVDGTIVNQQESSSSNTVSSAVVGHIEKPSSHKSALPPVLSLKRDSGLSQIIPISQVQPNVKRSPLQNVINSPQEVPIIQGAPLPVPFPVIRSQNTNCSQNNPINLVQNEPSSLQNKTVFQPNNSNLIEIVPVSQSCNQNAQIMVPRNVNLPQNIPTCTQITSQNGPQVPQSLPRVRPSNGNLNEIIQKIQIYRQNVTESEASASQTNTVQGNPVAENVSGVQPINANLGQNFLNNQVSGQNGYPVAPIGQHNQNLTQNIPNNPDNNQTTCQNGPLRTQNNPIVPVSQGNQSTPHHISVRPTHNLLMAQNGPSASRINVTVPMNQVPPTVSRNVQSIIASQSQHQQTVQNQNSPVRQPIQNGSSVQSAANPLIPQSFPHVAYPHQQAMMGTYPPQQMLSNNGMINRTSSNFYQFPTNQELISYPQMYRPYNILYAYENKRRQALAKQNYDRMMWEQMQRGPPSYQQFVTQRNNNRQDFQTGLPTTDTSIPAGSRPQQLVISSNRQPFAPQNYPVQPQNQQIQSAGNQMVQSQNRQHQSTGNLVIQRQNHQLQVPIQTQNLRPQSGSSQPQYHRLLSGGCQVVQPQLQQVQNQIQPGNASTVSQNLIQPNNSTQKQPQPTANQSMIVPKSSDRCPALRCLLEPKEAVQQQNQLNKSDQRSQPNPIRPAQRLSSRSLDELEAMADDTIKYLIDPNSAHKAPTKTLVRPSLIEIERLQRELEEINRNYPSSSLTSKLPQPSYDMNSVVVTESSTVSTSVQASEKTAAPKDVQQHTIKWRMKKSATQNEQPVDSSSSDQSRQDGSVIRYQPEAHNTIRNISRDSGYLSPFDVAHQNPEHGVICERCMGPSRLMCSGCHTYYCSIECQQLSWPEHEKKCFTINEVAE